MFFFFLSTFFSFYWQREIFLMVVRIVSSQWKTKENPIGRFLNFNSTLQRWTPVLFYKLLRFFNKKNHFEAIIWNVIWPDTMNIRSIFFARKQIIQSSGNWFCVQIFCRDVNCVDFQSKIKINAWFRVLDIQDAKRKVRS